MIEQSFADEVTKVAEDDPSGLLRKMLALGGLGAATYGAYRGGRKLQDMAMDRALGITHAQKRIAKIRARNKARREVSRHRYKERPGRGRREREFGRELEQAMRG